MPLPADSVRTWGQRIGWGVAALALLYVVRCDGRRAQAADDRIAAGLRRIDTLVIERAAKVDTVRVATAARAKVERATVALHDSVTIHDTTTLIVRVTPDSVVRVEVPPVVIRRIASDSILIQAQRVELGAFRRLVASDSALIREQGTTIHLLQAKSAPRCGWRCGAVGGVLATSAALYLTTRVIGR